MLGGDKRVIAQTLAPDLCESLAALDRRAEGVDRLQLQFAPLFYEGQRFAEVRHVCQAKSENDPLPGSRIRRHVLRRRQNGGQIANRENGTGTESPRCAAQVSPDCAKRLRRHAGSLAKRLGVRRQLLPQPGISGLAVDELDESFDIVREPENREGAG